MNYDMTIERHRVIKAGIENGWSRSASPNFDLWSRGDREVQVFYSNEGSTVNSAASIDHGTRTTKAVRPPEDLVAQVLQWLSAP